MLQYHSPFPLMVFIQLNKFNFIPHPTHAGISIDIGIGCLAKNECGSNLGVANNGDSC